MLPNFFVVGAQKAATTTLHNYLAAHPDVYLPEQKETKFFVMDERYNRGIDYYEKTYYSGWRGESAIGEVDPDYMYFEQAIERMASHMDLSTVRLVFILRNPVERAFSHYLMTYRRGLEPQPFSKAISVEQERIGTGYEARNHYSYVSRGFYLRQIEYLQNFVDRRRMYFMLTEDLDNDPQTAMKNLCGFLGVDPEGVNVITGQRFHAASVPRSMGILHFMQGDSLVKNIVRTIIPWKGIRLRLHEMLIRLNQRQPEQVYIDAESRKALLSLYRAENERLGEFIRRDLSSWNT